jgi:Putative metallopeptidase
MKYPVLRALALALIGLAPASSSVLAGEPIGSPGTIADNDSIFIDGTTFRITLGKSKADATPELKTLSARDLGPGAIIFRSGEKLYIVEAPLAVSTRDRDMKRNIEADQAQPNRIRVEYDPPKDPKHQMLYDQIRERRVLEKIQRILSPFRLPVDLVIKTQGCDGMINSWFNTDGGKPTVHMCYELLADILKNVPEGTTPAGITPTDAVAGQVLFWTLHEVGHAFFDIFQTPLLGREEDAADQFAVFLMLQFGKDESRRLIGGAAFAANEVIKTFDQNSSVEKPLAKYSSVHGLPEQRFYNLVCWAYGADPMTFADVVDKGYLPKRRAGNCEYEYQTFKRAFVSEMLPHVDRQMAQAVLSRL